MPLVERLIDYYDIDPMHICFGEPQVSIVPDTNITYTRIPISIEHGGGSVGPLIIKTRKCFTFGAQKDSVNTKELSRWTLPIVMYDRDEPTADQVAWVNKFDEIIKVCKDYLINKFDFKGERLTKLGNSMWRPTNDLTKGPTLYPKIICGRLNKRYDTKFRMVDDLFSDSLGTLVRKEALTDNYHVIAAIRIDSIYVGNENISVQVKVSEALIEELEELPSLLRPVHKTSTKRSTLFKD